MMDQLILPHLGVYVFMDRNCPDLNIFVFGGQSFSSAVKVALNCGLQPLKLQGLNPLVRRSYSSGLKSRPPRGSWCAKAFQIRAVPRDRIPC
jgi:hypothetical protein